MIFVFSGTGNSLYIGQMLAHRLQDEIVDISKYTKIQFLGQFNSEKPLVFVAPVYVSAPPLVVMDFVRHSQFTGNKKAYFIQTCAGGMGACPTYWKEIAKEKKFDYMGCEQVVMPQNYLVFFHTKNKETSLKIVQDSHSKVEEIIACISKQKAISMKEPTSMEIISTKLILKPYYDLFINDKAFIVKDSCVGCKQCEKVCPLNNIKIIDGKPVWNNNCTHCMACINLCPKEAIEYGKKSIGKPRYKAPKYKKAN